MDTRIDHRRDRHQARRILADFRIRYCGLGRLPFQEDSDLVNDEQNRLPLIPNGGRH